jgi:hypothetical protein
MRDEINKYKFISTLGFRIATRWMRMMMVMMKIIVDASKIRASAAMVSFYEYSLHIYSKDEVSWYCDGYVSLISDLSARDEKV